MLAGAATAAVVPLPVTPYTVTIETGPSLTTLRFARDAFYFGMSRLDVICGVSANRPQFACRIMEYPPEPREWIRMKLDPARLPA